MDSWKALTAFLLAITLTLIVFVPFVVTDKNPVPYGWRKLYWVIFGADLLLVLLYVMVAKGVS